MKTEPAEVICRRAQASGRIGLNQGWRLSGLRLVGHQISISAWDSLWRLARTPGWNRLPRKIRTRDMPKGPQHL